MNWRRVLCISQEKLKIIKPPRLLLHEKIPNRYNFILELLQHYQIYFLPKINCYKKSVLDLIRAYFYCIKLVCMYNWNYTQVQKRKPPYPLQNSLFIKTALTSVLVFKIYLITNVNCPCPKLTNLPILKKNLYFLMFNKSCWYFIEYFVWLSFQMSGFSSNSASPSGVGNDVAGKAALFRPYALPPSPSVRYLDPTSPLPPVAHRVMWGMD